MKQLSDEISCLFRVNCSLCGAAVTDDGWRLQCHMEHGPSLLVSDYCEKELRLAEKEEGLYRYRSWLPIRRTLIGSGRTVSYRSERLSKITGLRNLWIAFNGYWPEKGAMLPTGTFKDLEAYAVLSYMARGAARVLVVASAGNTAAAFARACAVNCIHCLIVIPDSGIEEMRLDLPLSSCVKVVALSGGSDYSDAIRFAEAFGHRPGYLFEGGTRNVARRDGLGTVLLNAFEAIGHMPDYYFQAIGSGAGAIAVHEAARRVTKGRGPFPRLWLSQNEPFTPIYTAWKRRSRMWEPVEEELAKYQISKIGARVLSNRFPAYAIQGGLYDVLLESNGEVLKVTNERATMASELFETSEGIDINPAAAVAFASLLEASGSGVIDPDATVVLNISGGGRHKLGVDRPLFSRSPDLTIQFTDFSDPRWFEQIDALFP